MCLRPHENCPFFLSDFNKTCIISTNFPKISHIRFNQNLSSGSRVVPCERTDMTKLIVGFRNFANTPIIMLLESFKKPSLPQVTISG
jgi:hypothetical protein